jgi:histidinol dehydrogenase
MTIKYLKKDKPKTESDIDALQKTVRRIITKVRNEGDSALKHFQEKFDNHTPESFRVTPKQASQAKDRLPPEIIEELDFAMEQVTLFAQAQKDCFSALETEIKPGMKMGHRVIPVDSCGCYIPAGRYPCLTAAVMSIAPAKVAGVERIVAVSPPGTIGEINPGILYTIYKLGCEEIFCMGGAQAIAAMAYGTETIAPVDLIVGPGNQYVAEAKRQVYGKVGIDFLAGPSEVLIIADESARSDYIAADLLAQAEHDPNARACLVTIDQDIAEKVIAEVENQLKQRSTEEVARASWNDFGIVAVADDINEAIAYTNRYAPEHLEIHTVSPREVLKKCRHYGSAFLGEDTAEVYADKIAGPNHTLPTSGAARYTGGLWVGMYMKVQTHMETDKVAGLQLAKYSEIQGRYEGMDAHRYAATIRLNAGNS